MGSKMLLVSLYWMIFTLTLAVQANRNTVTNEDIRDAILQVVNVVRATEDKLERHEFRERVLGDQLKKGMISIDKRIKILDSSRGPVSRLDERLAAVETILIQRDERERTQSQKTSNSIEDLQKTLPNMFEQFKQDILNKVNEAPSQDINKLFEDFKKDVIGRLDQLTTNVKTVENNLENLKKDNDLTQKINNQSLNNLNDLKKQINSTQDLLEKYENKLAEYNNRIIQEPPASFAKPTDMEAKLLKALEVQKSNVEQILSEVQSIDGKIQEIPNKTDLETVQNTTLINLEQLKYEISQQPIKSAKILDAKVKSLNDEAMQKHEETIKSINEMSEVTLQLTESFTNNYEQIRKEMQNLGKVEQVMVQTADSVLDTKRRVEYGVHQILAEVGQLVKATSKEINGGINERFDNFETSILDDENGALANLTNKIEEEISQVWRQIGIMHQQMSATGDTLTKLQNQTDHYVTGSLNVMDNMKGKVGKITSRITELDENLNFLLGRLGVVAQEFNRIKSGLSKALDEIKGTFKAVEQHIPTPTDTGPGPHKIVTSNEIQ